MENRVVITGLGIVSPIAHDVESFWQALMTNVSGVANTTIFDASTFPTHFSAEVKDYDLSDFNAFTGGLGLTHRPVGRKNGTLSAVTWQYFYYGRSNQLQAHTLSMVFDFSVR